MARPRLFDEKEVLLNIMKLFWKKGFETTSMSDLLKETGLSKSSLYNTFGNKRDIFLSALDMYHRERMINLRKYLQSEDNSFDSIKAFFEMVLTHARQEKRPFGCMSCNELAEFSSNDPEIMALIKKDFQGIEDELTSAIIRGFEDGSIPKGKDPRKLARFLTVSHHGIQLMSRSNPEPERLDDALDMMLSILK